MEDTHNEDKVTTMEDILTTTTPTTILPRLEDKKEAQFYHGHGGISLYEISHIKSMLNL